MNKKIVLPFLLSSLALTACGKDQDNTMKVTAEPIAAQTSGITGNYTDEPSESCIVSAGSTAAASERETEAVQATEEKEDKNEQNENKIKENFEDDLYIIGDSIALGYGAYQRVPSRHVLAELNAAPSSIRDFTFDYDGKKHTVLAILNDEMPENIMLSMGVNDITTYSDENFAEKYMGFVSDVKTLCPDSNIYVMALTPVMKSCEYTDNDAINSYNNALKSAVEAQKDDKITFIDVPPELFDKSGNLKSEYSSGDGMHLTGDAYDVLLDNMSEYINAAPHN
ncbi:MAG: GDSL-type esterase/lipase family protein [Porcipelethomonas sp.]